MSPVLSADPICESSERNAGLGGVVAGGVVSAGVVGVVVAVEAVDAALGMGAVLDVVLMDPLSKRLVTVS
jgi:hypothetical protein